MKVFRESIDATGEFEKSPAFSTYSEILEGIAASGADTPEGLASGKLAEEADKFARYHPDVKPVGAGSSRKAYAFSRDPRYVLKVAYNVQGMKQNATEISTASRGDYSCFVRILAYDDTRTLIVQDRCDEATYPEWRRIAGLSLDRFSQIVWRVLNVPDLTLREFADECRRLKGEECPWLFAKRSPKDEEYRKSEMPGILAACDGMIAAFDGKPVAARWKALCDVIRFYLENGQQALILDEISWIDQWGVLGKGTPDERLVILDAGVDEDTFRRYVPKDEA